MLGGVMIDGTKLLSDKPAEWGRTRATTIAPGGRVSGRACERPRRKLRPR
jgi:hypothetical protein